MTMTIWSQAALPIIPVKRLCLITITLPISIWMKPIDKFFPMKQKCLILIGVRKRIRLKLERHRSPKCDLQIGLSGKFFAVFSLRSRCENLQVFLFFYCLCVLSALFFSVPANDWKWIETIFVRTLNLEEEDKRIEIRLDTLLDLMFGAVSFCHEDLREA